MQHLRPLSQTVLKYIMMVELSQDMRLHPDARVVLLESEMTMRFNVVVSAHDWTQVKNVDGD